jgi:hypothetical protein
MFTSQPVVVVVQLLHNNIIAAHTIQPHLATELKALLNRSSHNFLIEHILRFEHAIKHNHPIP